jgi:hypothetical protein
MQVLEGTSFATDGTRAVTEALAGWPEQARPDVLFAFASTAQDTDLVARELERRFPGVPLLGCSTSGEQLGGKHANGSLVISGLCETGITWACTRLDHISTLDEAAVREASDVLFGALSLERELFDPTECFCAMVIDGLSGREEVVSALVAEAIEGIALAGGSAGDDLAFRATRVMSRGSAHSDAAVLLMGRGKGRFSIMKHQHFTRTPQRLVITRVDTPARRVYEINGLPAIEAYARALGLTPAQVDDQVTFLNPVTFSCEGELYVRSIQRVMDDGSIVFYCGVEEGMVLQLGGHHDMIETLEADMSQLARRGRPAFLLSYNCILRALEAKAQGLTDRVFALLGQGGCATIGFDTYGEQLDGLHINQTLVTLALHDNQEAA